MTIRDFVLQQPLYDTHEHHISLKAFEQQRETFDYKSLLGYAKMDLAPAAGAGPAEGLDEDALLSKYWPKIITTGYGQAAQLGCSQLFNVDCSVENFPILTGKVRELANEKSAKDLYDEILVRKAGVSRVVQHGYVDLNAGFESFEADAFPEYYKFAWNFPLGTITDLQPILPFEQFTGIQIYSVADLINAMRSAIDIFRENAQFACVKIAMAYTRPLTISKPSRQDAERALSTMMRGTHEKGVFDEGAKNLSDFMLHELFAYIEELNIPVQIHTGYLSGSWMELENAKAMHLLPVFYRYRKLRFDIFHGSLPWISELAMIAKNYPNVYVNLCWAWAMSPGMTERGLCDLIDTVPHNKILGFGGDIGLPFETMGYAMQARSGIARALERKIGEGRLSDTSAQEIAEAIMFTNALELYG